MIENNPPDLKTLRRLRPLSQFSNEQLQSLAHQLNVRIAHKSEVLIKLDCSEAFSLFVLKGKTIMTARDGKKVEHDFNEDEELNPVAQLRPSMYQVEAASYLEYIKIDGRLLTEFANLTESGEEDISLQMIEEEIEANPLTLHLFQDLMEDKVTVPSLPAVALKIQQVFRDDQVSVDKVSEILMTDPAITGKLIKVANSPVYQGVASTETLPAAIVRLGMDATYKQVMAYAVNELFQSQSANVSDRMEKLWSHSRKVAAISRVLAKSTGLFDPEHAMLAGLVHDLGVIVIVNYLQDHESEFTDPDMVEQTINTLRPQITGMLMQKWNFSDEVITVAEECEDWFRNTSNEADLCDLIMIAQYHSLMGSDAVQSMPPITTIPAMSKLKMGPKESIELIKQSNQEISEIEQLLR